jgi:error-prone DNA polymerase
LVDRVRKCGYALHPMRSLSARALVLAELSYRHEWLAEHAELGGKLQVRWTSCGTSTRARSCLPAQRRPAHLRELTYRGAIERFPEGVPESVTAQIEHELAS